MKKVIRFFLISSLCLCLSSCEVFKIVGLTAEYVSEEVVEKANGVIDSFVELEKDNRYLDELSTEIVRCFDEKDAEGLKALFCTNEKNNNSEIDSQIENTFSFYEGKSQSFYVTDKSSAGSYVDGVCNDKHFTPKIREIITDEGRTYTISYLVYSIYIYDSGKVGISAIGLKDETGEEIAGIG